MTEPLTAPSHSELATVTPLPAPCPLQAVPSGPFCDQNQSQRPHANLPQPLLGKPLQLPRPPRTVATGHTWPWGTSGVASATKKRNF